MKYSRGPRIGAVQQELLTMLYAGLALSVAITPRAQWRILSELRGELGSGRPHNAERAVSTLYTSKLVRAVANTDGTHTLVLSERGKKTALRFSLSKLSITRPACWDGLWRLVLYDIPERKRGLRVDLARTLKRLGFYELQQSAWVHPFPCTEEIEFLIEAYGAREYVRRMTVSELDSPEVLRKHFKLRS